MAGKSRASDSLPAERVAGGAGSAGACRSVREREPPEGVCGSVWERAEFFLKIVFSIRHRTEQSLGHYFLQKIYVMGS